MADFLGPVVTLDEDDAPRRDAAAEFGVQSVVFVCPSENRSLRATLMIGI